jgi:DNA invertase Pin-like site-specific DNA recombinase
MRTKVAQLELRPCAGVFNLAGERGVDGARAIAEMAEATRREREARAWAAKMQRKLSECPGFIGCHPPGVETPGTVTVQPESTDEALEFLKRRFHVGQVDWQRGMGMILKILPRRKGVSRAVVRRRLSSAEQFQFSFGSGHSTPV